MCFGMFLKAAPDICEKNISNLISCESVAVVVIASLFITVDFVVLSIADF